MSEGHDAERDPSIQRAEQAVSLDTLDPAHSQHVVYLSLRLYDQLAEPLGLPPEGRDLLAAAALWHDVGQHFGQAQHHRASFNLIMKQPLRGFSRVEQLQIANIARYHRRAHPDFEHPGYLNLPDDARPVVDAMAALLRLAEALDASHMQVVTDIVCNVQPGYVSVRVIATTYPMLETERAQERSGLFREVFGLVIEFIPEIRRNGPPRATTPDDE